MPSVPASQKQIFCNRCERVTNHVCRAEHQCFRSHNGFESEETWYRLWTCAGCDHGLLETSYSNTGYGPEEPDVEYYPKRKMLMKKRFVQLPPRLRMIYSETIEAFNGELRLLCAIGLRSLVEGICDDKGVQGENLQKKIQDLTNILPQNIVDNIDQLRFVGNVAVHKLKPPINEVLLLGIEVMEDILNFLYELEFKASGLSKYGQTGSTLETIPIQPRQVADSSGVP